MRLTAGQEPEPVLGAQDEHRGRESVGFDAARRHHRGREHAVRGPAGARVQHVARPLVPAGGRDRGVPNAKGRPGSGVRADRIADVDDRLTAEGPEAAAPQVDEARDRARGAESGDGLVRRVALGDPAEVEAGAGRERHAVRGAVQLDAMEANPGPEPSTLRGAERAARPAEAPCGADQGLDGGIEGAGRIGRDPEGMSEDREEVHRSLDRPRVVEMGELALPVQGETRLDAVESGEGGVQGP